MGKPRWKIRTGFNLVCVAFTILWVVAVVNVLFSDGRSTWSLRSRRPRPAQPQVPSAARYIPIAAQEDGNDSSLALHFAKPDHELAWPPLLPNGTVPDADGADTMPLMDVHVPRFYQPPPSVDLDAVGFAVNGEETIFLMIASYRDFQVPSLTILVHVMRLVDTSGLPRSAGKPSPLRLTVRTTRGACTWAWWTKRPPGTPGASTCRCLSLRHAVPPV